MVKRASNSAQKAIQARMILEMLEVEPAKAAIFSRSTRALLVSRRAIGPMEIYASLEQYLAWRLDDVGAK